MPVLAQDEVYRLFKPVDLGSVLPGIDRLPFFTANAGGDPSDPKRMPCDVVMENKFSAELRALVSGLGLGGSTARAILRRLAPFQGIPAHVDEWMPSEANWRRFQLPIVTHPDIKMRWPQDGVEVHLAAGNLYEVRFDRLHEVVNPTPVARLHLQIDQVDATI